MRKNQPTRRGSPHAVEQRERARRDAIVAHLSIPIRLKTRESTAVSVLYVALPLALILGGGGLVACVLCIRNGQYDDLDTPAVRMLIDDDDDRAR